MSGETRVEKLSVVVELIAEEEEEYNSALYGKNHPWVVELITREYVLVGESKRGGTGDVGEACENWLRRKV